MSLWDSLNGLLSRFLPNPTGLRLPVTTPASVVRTLRERIMACQLVFSTSECRSGKRLAVRREPRRCIDLPPSRGRKAAGTPRRSLPASRSQGVWDRSISFSKPFSGMTANPSNFTICSAGLSNPTSGEAGQRVFNDGLRMAMRSAETPPSDGANRAGVLLRFYSR